MYERDRFDERRRGSTPEPPAPPAKPAATPGRESLAWIRALANAWEDEGHPDHREPYVDASVGRERRSQ